MKYEKERDHQIILNKIVDRKMDIFILFNR